MRYFPKVSISNYGILPKQSLGPKCVPKQELGNERYGTVSPDTTALTSFRKWEEKYAPPGGCGQKPRPSSFFSEKRQEGLPILKKFR